MRFICAVFSFLVVCALSSNRGHAEDVSTVLRGIELGGIKVGSCTVGAVERHSLSADFSLPINLSQTVFVRDGRVWDVYATINVSGAANGAVAGLVSGTLDDWTLGLQGSGSANLRVHIPVTGSTRRGRARSFGYLTASIRVELSDTGTLQSQCSQGQQGPPVVSTQAPVVQTTVSIVSARYTGPGQIFPRLRQRIESTMRDQFKQQVENQIRRGASNYAAKRDGLVGQLVAKLPDGCLCFRRNQPVAHRDVGTNE